MNNYGFSKPSAGTSAAFGQSAREMSRLDEQDAGMASGIGGLVQLLTYLNQSGMIGGKRKPGMQVPTPIGAGAGAGMSGLPAMPGLAGGMEQGAVSGAMDIGLTGGPAGRWNTAMANQQAMQAAKKYQQAAAQQALMEQIISSLHQNRGY